MSFVALIAAFPPSPCFVSPSPFRETCAIANAEKTQADKDLDLLLEPLLEAMDLNGLPVDMKKAVRERRRQSRERAKEEQESVDTETTPGDESEGGSFLQETVKKNLLQMQNLGLGMRNMGMDLMGDHFEVDSQMDLDFVQELVRTHRDRMQMQSMGSIIGYLLMEFW